MRPRSLLMVVAVGLATLTGLPATATAAPAPAAPAAAPAAATLQTSRTVSLITGDVVRIGPGPVSTANIAVVPRDRSGAAGQLKIYRDRARVSVVPALAMPYLGRRLDPALFDVTALAAAPAGRLPVRVAYTAGARHHAIPGLTVTSTSGDTDTGYLTAASARRFGQALADQVRSDAAAGWPTGAGLFAGISAIRYAGAVSPVVTPRFPMFTLRIPMIDSTGQPAAFGSVYLVNVDDARKYLAFAFAENGEARVSVPAGNYALLATFQEFGADGSLVDRLVNVSDFAVTGPTTLRPVDARTASTEVRLASTPRPATVDDFTIDWTRLDDSGVGGISAGFSYPPDGIRVLVAAGRPVVHGQLAWSNRWHLTSTDGSYTYDVKFGTDGAVPTRQVFTVTAGQLATLTVKYHSDVPDREIYTTRFGFRPPVDYGGFQALLPVPAPSTRTEYVGGSPDVRWQQTLIGFLYFDENVFILADSWDDGIRVHPAGSRTTVEWARQPVHPSLEYDTGNRPDGYPFFCPACRTGDRLAVYVAPLTDTVPGHIGYLDAYGDTPIGRITASTRMRVYRAGTLLSDERDVYGTELTVPAADARYRVVYNQSRQAPWIRFGTRSTTEWTFRSATPTAATAPAGWICPEGSGPCAVQPLLTASYQVPTDGLGTVAPGPGSVVLTLRPTQGAAAVPVDEAGLSWSTDDGVTWTQATVRPLGGGRFSAAVPNPTGATVSLRITGADRTGNTITQTLVRAYAVR